MGTWQQYEHLLPLRYADTSSPKFIRPLISLGPPTVSQRDHSSRTIRMQPTDLLGTLTMNSCRKWQFVSVCPSVPMNAERFITTFYMCKFYYKLSVLSNLGLNLKISMDIVCKFVSEVTSSVTRYIFTEEKNVFNKR